MADETEALDQQHVPEHASAAQQEASTSPEVPQEPTNLPPYERCSCLRCGHEWKARNPDKRPVACARCGSASWDVPPQRKHARRPDDPPNPNWKYRLKPIKRDCPTCGRPWTRLTVRERQKLEQKERERLTMEISREQLTREAEARAAEVPSRSRLTDILSSRKPMDGGTEITTPLHPTPPPSLRQRTPPPTRRSADNPETVASSRTLSDELKEKT